MMPGNIVAPTDRGFTLGDGVFETVLWAAEPQYWDLHMARMARACDALGLPRPDPHLLLRRGREAAAAYERAAVRLSWTAGPGGRGLQRPAALEPQLVVTAAPAPEASGPVRLMISSVRRNEGSPASRLKTLSYLDNILARREAELAGFDDAIMINNRDELACTTVGNLFWMQGDRLVTPALDCGVLDGVIRSRIIERLPRVEEVRAGPEVLTKARAIFLTNSLGIRRVTSLGGLEVPQDEDLYVQVEQVIWEDRLGRK